MLFYYVIVYVGNTGVPSACTSSNESYSNFFAIFHMVFYSLAPSFLMLMFGLLTIMNIRKNRRIIDNNNNNRGRRRTDSQLLRMLTVQVLAIIVFTLPYSIMRLYQTFTSSMVKSSFRRYQESIAVAVFYTLPYFAHSSSFYLYTLTGTIFRQEFLKIWPCFRSQNQVLPSTNTKI